MSIFKGVHFFRSTTSGLGWSEVWYVDAPDYNTAVSSMANIATRRCRVLANDVLIEYQRVIGNQPLTTQVRARQQRSAVLDKLDLQGIAGAGLRGVGDLSWVAVKMRWAASAVEIFRTQLLRGVPDDWYDGGSDKVAKARLAEWAPTMVQALRDNSARIRHVFGPPITPGIRDYHFESPVNGTYEGYTRRATGRPFGLPRGRRAARTV
jgi:hypothetical protein